MRDADFETPEFLAALRRGEGAAFRRLIRRYHAPLVAMAGGVLGSRALAEEAVQDSWLAVHGAIGRFEGRSTLASWIFTIVLNRARGRARHEGRTVGLAEGLAGGRRAVPDSAFLEDGHWREVPALWDELDPERVVGGRQLWAIVQDAIGRLPASQRAVIVLRDLEGGSAEEACALFGLSAENQRVLLHRARNAVRAAIDTAVGGKRERFIPRAARRTARGLAVLLAGIASLARQMARQGRRNGIAAI